MPMARNPLIRKVPKMTGKTTGGHKSAGILDDNAIRKTVETRQGTIIKTPTVAKDIVNKEYVDSLIPVKLNEVANPDASKTFNLGNNKFLSFTSVDRTPIADEGIFNWECSGAFTGDLCHMHQHIGNAGAGTILLHLEASDTDITPFRITDGTPATVFDVDLSGNVEVGGRIQDKTGFVCPVGTILMYGASIPPATGWLLCDGSSLSTTGTYADLFAVIAYGFGGSGANFNLPNFTDKFPKETNNPGETGGSDDAIVVTHGHTFTGNAHKHTMPSHRHLGGLPHYTPENLWNVYGSAGIGTHNPIRGGGGANLAGECFYTQTVDPGDTNNATQTGSIGSAGASGVGANIPAYLGVRFIIKY